MTHPVRSGSQSPADTRGDSVPRAAGAAPRRAAVGHLIEQHLPDLTAYVRRRTDPLVSAKESAADLVQSVCREVIEHASRFRHDDDDGFRRWLFRTAERKIIDRYRYYTAERRTSTREVSDDPDSPLRRFGLTPSQDAIAREELLHIERAFAELPAHYREVIVLARMERCSHAEIAARLHKSEGAVRNLLYRGLVALSAHLDQPPGPRNRAGGLARRKPPAR